MIRARPITPRVSCTLVIIPTYNEQEDPGRDRRAAWHKTQPGPYHALDRGFDDAAPTARGGGGCNWPRACAGRYHRVQSCPHVEAAFVAAAYPGGIRLGSSIRRYSVLVEMTPTAQHPPEQLQSAAGRVDRRARTWRIGSLYDGPGAMCHWPRRRWCSPPHRQRFARILRGEMSLHHPPAPRLTGARCGEIDLAAVDAKGYCCPD